MPPTARCPENQMSIVLPAPYEPVPLERICSNCDHHGLLELRALVEPDPPPTPFIATVCSGFPNAGIHGRDRYQGRFIHDISCLAGKPNDDLGRLKADVWLVPWVAERVEVRLGLLVFSGVRAGGSEKLPTPWRWGFGRVLSAED